MRMQLQYSGNYSYWRNVKRTIKEAQQEMLKKAVKQSLKRLLLPASQGGLPTFRSQSRASFDAIAKEYGLRNAGPYTPHPFNDMKSAGGYYYHQFNKRKAIGLANPVTDNDDLDAVKEKYDYRMYINIEKDGFDYFRFNELEGHDYPWGQLDTPWNLLVAMGEAGKDYMKKYSEKHLKHGLNKPSIRRRRIV